MYIIATAVEPICSERLAPILCTICPPINNIIIEPIEALLSKVPKVPLLIFRFAFRSGVLGASDIIAMPNSKNIRLRYLCSLFE
jgi:hypothetical protein